MISLRQILLLLVLVGIVGLIAELLLLGHTDSFNQWIPLIVMIVGLVSTLVVMFRPGNRSIRVFQWVMASFVMAGVLGLYLHFRGNVEFALERYPEMSGLSLVWKALRGATPTLAPGALAQLGLLGLVYSYKHPALSDGGKGDTED
jgi:FtsH-binding integral membrane protein